MSWLRTASVASVGAAAGVAAALLVGYPGAPASAVEASAKAARDVKAESRKDVRPRTDEAPADARLARLERELAELREQQAPPSQDTSAEPAVDDEAAFERTRETFAASLKDFESAPVDPVWAPQATRTLQTELGALSKQAGFNVEDVQCKDKRCVARLRWPTYKDASERFGDVAHARYAAGCAVDIRVQKPAGEADGVVSSAVFSQCK
ncbi:hypothetical protein WMF30_23040 [Sorangium sp. So ce134]